MAVVAPPFQRMASLTLPHRSTDAAAAAAAWRCAEAARWRRRAHVATAPVASSSGSRLVSAATSSSAAAAAVLGRRASRRAAVVTASAGVGMQALAEQQVLGTTTDAVEDDLLVAQVVEAARQLEALRDDWEALPSNGRGPGELQAPTLLERDQRLRESLRALPLGDPSETTTVIRHACRDPVVRAYGDATRAIIEAELSRVRWEVRCAEAQQQEMEGTSAASVSSAIINTAVLRMRLFDIDGAYAELRRASAYSSSDERLGVLTRYNSMLKAPRSANFLDTEDLSHGSRCEALLRQVRGYLVNKQYQTQMVLKATKASSMSEFIFVESRADQLERGLLENIEESNPMKPEAKDPEVPVELVDLIRIFLLRRVLPLARISQLLGSECCQLLLSLQVITAVAGNDCDIVAPAEAVAAVQRDSVSCGAFFAFANVALWPAEEDLIIATDFEQTFSSDDLEPVMYLSEDSLALVSGAPRVKASRVLDLCCGSGVQGIVALRHYAESATFVDLNPRAMRFVKLNLALNGLTNRAAGIHLGNLYDALPTDCGRFDAIVANPPFVPNPQGIASGGGAMFGNGGDTGEQVLAAIVQGAHKFLMPGGRLSTVSMAPNVESMPARIEGWYAAGAGPVAGFDSLVFRGPPTRAERYLPTSSSVETHRYQGALARMGITTLSEVVMVMVKGTAESGGPNASLAGDPRENLWSDHYFLRLVVQRAVPSDDANVQQAQPSVTQEGQLDRKRLEGNLPGFQLGFFPAHCTGPTTQWVSTAKELEIITAANQKAKAIA